MKISKIILTDYLHFQKDLEIDLTYPKGHLKEGKPLEKICFLGQSGTGKTALLNLIKYFTAEKEEYDKSCLDVENIKSKSVEIFYELEGEIFSKISNEEKYSFDYFKNLIIQPTEYKKHIEALSTKYNPLLIYFPFNVIPVDSDETEAKSSYPPFTNDDKSKNQKIFDLNKPDIDRIVSLVSEEIKNYVTSHQQKSMECLDKLKEVRNIDLLSELDQWEKENPSPIKKFSDFLNPVLKYFGLVVETDLKYYIKNKKEINDKFNFLILKQNGKQVPYRYLSTGTKQIILTSIPIFFRKIIKSIILFDQPEASLYPNIQSLLPQIYTDLSPTSQFFFATHSPVVASAFEPWEIVELKFDSENKSVELEKYFKNERDIKNYTIYPQYLTYGDIYVEIFDLEENNKSEYRGPKLDELIALKKQFLKMKEQKEPKEKLIEKLNEIKKVAFDLRLNLNIVLQNETFK